MSQEQTQYYDVTKTIYKGLKAIGVFGSGAGAAIMFPEPGAHWTQWVYFVLLCLPSLFDAFMNYTKHGGKGSPDVPPPALGTSILFFLCASLALSGCMGMAPAVMGKTHYNVEFVDQTANQNTQYKMDIKAPAGVDLATVTGMTYDWQPDGSGAISVSQQGNVDTKGQAAMITEVSRQQLEAFKAGMDSTLNALAPMIGPILQSKDNRAAINAASDAEIAEIVREAIGAKK